MLFSLHIENIALIKAADIEFDGGFTVFTGETGAGKSILIDAITLLCGDRGDRDIIRTDEKYALVEGCFGALDKYAAEKLKIEDVTADEDGNIYILRKILSDGHGTAKINGRTVPVSKLRTVASALLNIHGQQDTQSLSNAQTQLEFVDSFAKNGALLDEYARRFSEYKKKLKEKNDLLALQNDKQERLDIIEYKLSELEAAKLVPGQEETLLNERTRLRNIEKVVENAANAHKFLYGAGGAQETVYKAEKSVDKLAAVIPQVASLSERLESVLAEIEDIASELHSYAEGGDNSVARLDAVESRLEEISSLKRKYRLEVDGIIAYKDKLKAEKETIDFSDKLLEDAEMEAGLLLAELDAASSALTESRMNAARLLEKQIVAELEYLDMPGFVLNIDFEHKQFEADGTDKVRFLITANAGENPKPIEKIASGGELSRFMLALKSVFSEAENVPTMIFDEIDTGISGKTSRKTGIKLKQISKKEGRQVLCVTHAAQIASLANTHYLISKSSEDARTKTSILRLDKNGRINEISRIIGGIDVSDTVRKTAAEMLDSGESI